MKGGDENCFEIVREIWSAWPDSGAVNRRCADHAQACPVCGPELASFAALCARGNGADGRPLAWGGILSPERLGKLAEATRASLGSRPSPRRGWLWLPASAAVLAALLLARPRRHQPAPLPSGAVEAMEDMEMLDRIGLLENMEEVERLVRRTALR